MNITYVLVIFREIIEIILFINIANLNLKHISNLRQLNFISVGLSIITSVILLWIFNNYLNFDSNVQEIVNLCVLIIGFLCISYNACFSSNPKKHLANLNTKESFAIILTLFSIIFRECLEIMIFSYGVWTANKLSLLDLVTQFSAGLIAALSVGFIAKKGILLTFGKNMKSFFEITRLAMLLIAGSFLVKILNIVLEMSAEFDFANTAWLEKFESLAANSLNIFDFKFSQLDLIVYFLTICFFGIKYLPKSQLPK